MRVFVTPDRIELGPEGTVEVLITVHNTGTLIGGYQLRVLGADPSWVMLQADSLSLFPDESQTVTATVAVPTGVAAGERRMAVQVRELTPPHDIAINELELLVGSLYQRTPSKSLTRGATAQVALHYRLRLIRNKRLTFKKT